MASAKMNAAKLAAPKKKQHLVVSGVRHDAPPTLTTFSSDLLTPEEERELLTNFWDCKSELVRTLLRHFNRLRAHRPPLEPWPMAQFIRDYCDDDVRLNVHVRRVHDRYVHCKHKLASANIRL